MSVGDCAADLLSLKQLSVKFLLVDQPPPAAQSLQLTEHSSQPPVLQLQLMDFFFLIKHVEQTDYQNDHRGFDCQSKLSLCLPYRTFTCVRVSPSLPLVQPYVFLSFIILSTPSPLTLFTLSLTSCSICRRYSSSLA